MSSRTGGGAAPGERIVPNSSSAVVWRYTSFDLDGNGHIAFEETMHRTAGTVVERDDLLYVVDRSGLLHCVDVQQGRPHWTHDLLAGVTGWNTAPLLVEGQVYVAHETGITIVEHAKVFRVVNTFAMPSPVETTPIVANDVLFIARRGLLCAIAHTATGKKSAAGKPE